MVLTGKFTFLSETKRTFKGTEYSSVVLMDEGGDVWKFKVNDYVQPFVMGDKVTVDFNAFRPGKDYDGFVLSVNSIDIDD